MPTLHIYDPPWDALGYNASVARAVAAVYAEVMVAPVDTRFSYVGASTAIFNELPRLFPAAVHSIAQELQEHVSQNPVRQINV